MPFNFQLLKVPMQATPVREIVEGLEASLPPGAWPNYVLGNHDESRLATRLGPENARLAAMLLLTLRGAPTLFYGDEIGMQDVPVPLDAQQDPWGIRVPGLGRDKCRTPMQWDDGPNAGFSKAPGGKTWLPLAADYKQVNVKNQLEQPESILNLYRRLLALRRSSPALQTGDYIPIDDAPEDCFVFLRRSLASRAILVALNFSTRERRLSLTVGNSGRLLASTLMDRNPQDGSQHIDPSSLVLRGKEGILIELPEE
jgi:alpha-glucosidase